MRIIQCEQVVNGENMQLRFLLYRLVESNEEIPGAGVLRQLDVPFIGKDV